MPDKEELKRAPPVEPHSRSFAVLAVAVLGVVYGDIGTSPIYALHECFAGKNPILVTTEPPRLYRRLHFLRGWSNEQDDEVFPGSPGTGGAAGVQAPGGLRVTVGGDELDCSEDWLYGWVRQAERDQGRREGLTSSYRERLKALERESRELKRANEIMRKASAIFAQAELARKPK